MELSGNCPALPSAVTILSYTALHEHTYPCWVPVGPSRAHTHGDLDTPARGCHKSTHSIHPTQRNLMHSCFHLFSALTDAYPGLRPSPGLQDRAVSAVSPEFSASTRPQLQGCPMGLCVFSGPPWRAIPDPCGSRVAGFLGLCWLLFLLKGPPRSSVQPRGALLGSPSLGKGQVLVQGHTW